MGGVIETWLKGLAKKVAAWHPWLAPLANDGELPVASSHLFSNAFIGACAALLTLWVTPWFAFGALIPVDMLLRLDT